MLEQSSTSWYALSPGIRMDYVKRIYLTDLRLADSIFPTFDQATQTELIFKFIDYPTRFLPYKNYFHNAVTYELSNTNIT